MNRIFSLIIIVGGLRLIFLEKGEQHIMRTIDVGVDPAGFGAIFILLGVWLFITDKNKRP
jgi:hypothetical protein